MKAFAGKNSVRWDVLFVTANLNHHSAKCFTSISRKINLFDSFKPLCASSLLFMSMFWKVFVCVLFSLNLTYLLMFFQAHTLQYKILSESQLVKGG